VQDVQGRHHHLEGIEARFGILPFQSPVGAIGVRVTPFETFSVSANRCLIAWKPLATFLAERNGVWHT